MEPIGDAAAQKTYQDMKCPPFFNIENPVAIKEISM